MEDLPLNMLEAPTTLLLTSGLPIQHVLASGKIVDLPSDITFICEISNIVFAKYLALTKYVAIDVIRVFGFFYMLRFTIQFFGHINPYDGGFIETIYKFTEPYTRLFFRFFTMYLWLRYGTYCWILRFRPNRNNSHKNSDIRYNRQTLLKNY